MSDPGVGPMRLGIDLDGVVANFTAGWMQFYNREFGTDLAVEDSRQWNDVVHLTHFADISEFWAWTADLNGRSLFWHLDPFPGAIDALRSLDSSGHEIVILTAKPHFAIEDTYEWVEVNGIPTTEVHILDEKWLVECEVYLDDGPHVLPGLVENRPGATVCRYVRPWNRPLPGATDVRDFGEFSRIVGRLAESWRN